MQKDSASKTGTSNRKHGMSKTPLYKTWVSMKNRCSDKNNPAYPSYGGRGIAVCEEWSQSFPAFRMWAECNGYAPGLTLDRIDNDGNYDPCNCRFADMRTQSNNKRNNHFVTICETTHTISEWSRISGISKVTIRNRLEKGWTAENAVFHPLLRNRRKSNEAN